MLVNNDAPKGLTNALISGVKKLINVVPPQQPLVKSSAAPMQKSGGASATRVRSITQVDESEVVGATRARNITQVGKSSDVSVTPAAKQSVSLFNRVFGRVVTTTTTTASPMKPNDFKKK